MTLASTYWTFDSCDSSDSVFPLVYQLGFACITYAGMITRSENYRDWSREAYLAYHAVSLTVASSVFIYGVVTITPVLSQLSMQSGNLELFLTLSPNFCALAMLYVKNAGLLADSSDYALT